MVSMSAIGRSGGAARQGMATSTPSLDASPAMVARFAMRLIVDGSLRGAVGVGPADCDNTVTLAQPVTISTTLAEARVAAPHFTPPGVKMGPAARFGHR